MMMMINNDEHAESSGYTQASARTKQCKRKEAPEQKLKRGNKGRQRGPRGNTRRRKMEEEKDEEHEEEHEEEEEEARKKAKKKKLKNKRKNKDGGHEMTRSRALRRVRT